MKKSGENKLLSLKLRVHFFFFFFFFSVIENMRKINGGEERIVYIFRIS